MALEGKEDKSLVTLEAKEGIPLYFSADCVPQAALKTPLGAAASKIRREGGQSLVILEGKEGNPLCV